MGFNIMSILPAILGLGSLFQQPQQQGNYPQQQTGMPNIPPGLLQYMQDYQQWLNNNAGRVGLTPEYEQSYNQQTQQALQNYANQFAQRYEGEAAQSGRAMNPLQSSAYAAQIPEMARQQAEYSSGRQTGLEQERYSRLLQQLGMQQQAASLPYTTQAGMGYSFGGGSQPVVPQQQIGSGLGAALAYLANRQQQTAAQPTQFTIPQREPSVPEGHTYYQPQQTQRQSSFYMPQTQGTSYAKRGRYETGNTRLPGML